MILIVNSQFFCAFMKLEKLSCYTITKPSSSYKLFIFNANIKELYRDIKRVIPM